MNHIIYFGWFNSKKCFFLNLSFTFSKWNKVWQKIIQFIKGTNPSKSEIHWFIPVQNNVRTHTLYNGVKNL